MKKRFAYLTLGAILGLLVGLTLVASRELVSTVQPLPTARSIAAGKTPTPQPPLVVPGNLLANPSFEEPYSPQIYPEINVAQVWTAWYLDIPPCKPWKPNCYIPCPANCVEKGICQRDYGCMWARPEFAPASYADFSYRVHSGLTAQKYFSYGRMHEGGLYQHVTQVTPGTLLEFSTWIQTWMCFEYDDCAYGRVSDQPSDMHIRIGIDPTGGTVPTSTNVIWSAEAPAFDQWTHFSVQGRALAEAVTVFVHSRPEWDWARKNNDVYVDDASLVVLGPPAELFIFQPAQPELGQLTTVRLALTLADSESMLTIADPLSAPVASTQVSTETWQFTPAISGTYVLTLSTTALTAPVTATVRAIAAAHVSALPAAPQPGQVVTLYGSAYYPYAHASLDVADPEGVMLTPVYGGQAGPLPFVWTWTFTPAITGTYVCTFSADLLEQPVRQLVFAGGSAVYLPIILKE